MKITKVWHFCLTLATSIFIFSGCAKVALNMGATDYVVAVPATNGLIMKYKQGKDVDARLIKKGDSVSLHLQHAFIHDFSERMERVTSRLGFSTVRGEIAILAKVFEQANGKYIDFRPQSIKKKGRLIYYSEDVRSGGHHLNFSSIPIYGPIEYNGKSLVIQFTILELDIAESEQLKGMLGVLADLGQKAYPPSSVVLQVLDSVGQKLLSGDQDDIEFQYVFTLHPKEGHEDIAYPILQVGNYILLKEEPQIGGDTFKSTKWGELRLNHQTGQLEKRINENWENFKDNTYLVVQINSGLPSIGLDVAQSFAEFEAEVSQAKNYSELKTKLEASVETFMDKAKAKEDEGIIKELFHRSLTLIQDYENATDAEAIVKKNSLAEIFDIVVSKKGFPVNKDFTRNQKSRIIRKLRGIAKDPFDITMENVSKLSDARALEALLIKK